jgi:hypothetical protein
MHPLELFGEDWLTWGLDASDHVRQIGAEPLAKPNIVFTEHAPKIGK